MAHVADGLRVVLQAWHFELYVKYVRKYQNTPLSDKINKKINIFVGGVQASDSTSFLLVCPLNVKVKLRLRMMRPNIWYPIV